MNSTTIFYEFLFKNPIKFRHLSILNLIRAPLITSVNLFGTVLADLFWRGNPITDVFYFGKFFDRKQSLVLIDSEGLWFFETIALLFSDQGGLSNRTQSGAHRAMKFIQIQWMWKYVAGPTVLLQSAYSFCQHRSQISLSAISPTSSNFSELHFWNGKRFEKEIPLEPK